MDTLFRLPHNICLKIRANDEKTLVQMGLLLIIGQCIKVIHDKLELNETDLK